MQQDTMIILPCFLKPSFLLLDNEDDEDEEKDEDDDEDDEDEDFEENFFGKHHYIIQNQ